MRAPRILAFVSFSSFYPWPARQTWLAGTGPRCRRPAYTRDQHVKLVLIAECNQIRTSRSVRHVTDGAEHYDHRDAVGRRCLARYRPAGRGVEHDAAMSDGARMKSRNVLMASAVAVTMLTAGCSSGESGGGTPRLKLEKTDIVVNAFPAIDSAGLYIAQDQGLFAAQGLHVTIAKITTPPPSTQDLVDGQEQGQYDISAGDYVTYIEDQLGVGAPKADLRIIAESSFLQPNVLTLLVKGESSISQVSQLKGKTVSVNAPDDIGTLLIDSLLVAHGLLPRQVRYANMPFPAVAPTLIAPNSPVAASFAPEPFVSFGEAKVGLQELADLDQGATQDFPIQGYA